MPFFRNDVAYPIAERTNPTMKHMQALVDRAIRRVNNHLREFNFDVEPYARPVVSFRQFLKFYAFYGITAHHPIHFHFGHSSVAGSYFLGKCRVDHSILYKSDIRGDELKSRGDTVRVGDRHAILRDDETIRIQHSLLVKTLVHNYNHDIENPEEFPICQTFSAPYANIHGSAMVGCFLGPFATADLTTVHDCIIGAFAYVQTGELQHTNVAPGTVWIKTPSFEFTYRFPPQDLAVYIRHPLGEAPRGLLIDFVEHREAAFQPLFDKVHLEIPAAGHSRSALSRYAVTLKKVRLGDNVLVAQRAYLENARLGSGSNAQESCYIVDSHLEGLNVTAHGGKVVHAKLGIKVFVGFNSFLCGKPQCPLTIGANTIVLPHTIIDLQEPLEIPSHHLVWGLIRNRQDLAHNSLPQKQLTQVEGDLEIGRMCFRGLGRSFVEGFRQRIEHILEANGAYYDGKGLRGHAQKGQNISFNIIQPYTRGPLRGLYPTIDINP